MMLASVLCVDSVEAAKKVDSYFPDIRAYIASLEPPSYPGQIDQRLAATGKSIFEDMCSDCHGTYGDEESYPNKVVAVDEIGTDPWLAKSNSFYYGPSLDWFEKSFYGEISRLSPKNGYIAPPLDGIWASAPYFHNASVPTVAAVLDSSSRPAAWRRSEEYDHQNLGWRFEPASPHSEVAEDERRYIYDTSQKGYANTGHPFGDDLSPTERAAVIEYLKTL